MKKYFRILGNATFTGMLACVAATAAQAGQELMLVSNQSQVVTLAEPPSTVVVGNPAVTDVTTDGRSLFFHPRGFGLTNVIALDAEGKKLGDYQVRVIYEDSYSVSMYSPGGRQTYSCTGKECEPIMRLGDDDDYFNNYNTQASAANSLAISQAMGEDLIKQTDPNAQ